MFNELTGEPNDESDIGQFGEFLVALDEGRDGSFELGAVTATLNRLDEALRDASDARDECSGRASQGDDLSRSLPTPCWLALADVEKASDAFVELTGEPINESDKGALGEFLVALDEGRDGNFELGTVTAALIRLDDTFLSMYESAGDCT